MRHQSRGPTILDLQHQDCKREAGVSDISWEAVDTGAATHVVSEIIWCSRNIMTAKQTFSHTDKAEAVNGSLDARLDFWRSFKLSGQGQGSFSDTNQSTDE
jgi:hypothetical protein